MTALSAKDVERIHIQIIDASGGSYGTRDINAIKATVATQTQEVFGEVLYKLDLRRTSFSPELSRIDSEAFLSDGEVAVVTLTAEKEDLDDSGSSGEAGILRKSSKSVFYKAAALARGIIGNHPFIDGNKRTSIMCALIFLELNGINMCSIDNKHLEDYAVKVATEKLDVKNISLWLKSNSAG